METAEKQKIPGEGKLCRWDAGLFDPVMMGEKDGF